MTDTTSPASDPVLLFDRSTRFRMLFTGAKAGESLTGLVTNDVLSLRDGTGQYACALTNKGKIIADVRIFAITDADGALSYLVDSNAAAGIGFGAMIRKYVNPRLATYRDVSDDTGCLTLHGSGASTLLGTAIGDTGAGASLESAPGYAHAMVRWNDQAIRIARVPDLGDVSTIDLFADRPVLAACRDALLRAGAKQADDTEWSRRRTLAGLPEWGVDMDENTLAQEANMDALQAISYRKGCYTGQETVARVHFRGHVNRTLRRVHFADGIAPAIMTPLMNDEGTAVGDCRSSARGPDGSVAGIAMLRRELGDQASVHWTDAAGARHTGRVIGVADE